MDPNRSIVIRQFDNPIDAEVALEHLASHGITGFVRKRDDGGMRPGLNKWYGVTLIVLERDRAEAEEVLRAMNI